MNQTYLLPYIASLVSEQQQPQDTNYLLSSTIPNPEHQVLEKPGCCLLATCSAADTPQSDVVGWSWSNLACREALHSLRTHRLLHPRGSEGTAADWRRGEEQRLLLDPKE